MITEYDVRFIVGDSFVSFHFIINQNFKNEEPNC
jgi:hypothetical protein